MSPIETKQLPSRDGFDLRVELWPDQDLPEPDGNYRADDREAFARGDWGYYGIVVVASRAGYDLGNDSIWACEGGKLASVDRWIDPLADDDSTWAWYGPGLIEQAIEAAKAAVQAIGAGQCNS
jgi:hypothetical protein